MRLIRLVKYILLARSYFTTYFTRIVSFTIDSDFNLLHGATLTIWLIDVCIDCSDALL